MAAGRAVVIDAVDTAPAAEVPLANRAAQALAAAGALEAAAVELEELACPLAAGGLAADGIVVAEDLGPADVADVQGWACAAALAGGGPTAHAAIVARSLGVPMVCGLGASVLELAQGEAVVVDGDAGALVIDPAPVRL